MKNFNLRLVFVALALFCLSELSFITESSVISVTDGTLQSVERKYIITYEGYIFNNKKLVKYFACQIFIKETLSSQELKIHYEMRVAFGCTKYVCGVFISLTLSFPAYGQVETLFRDDFEGDTLNEEWIVRTREGEARLGRTQMSEELQSPVVSNSTARFQFDTYNPNRPGVFFLGTEMLTNTRYSLDMSEAGIIDFETSLRLVTPASDFPAGIVIAFFTFEGTAIADEIDIELVSSIFEPSNEMVLLNIFDDNEELGPALISVPEIDLNAFNTYKIRWEADKIEWYVNDQKIFTQTGVEGLSESEMALHLNFWAPEEIFELAFNEDFQPATTLAENESFFFEIDHVTVSAVPEPEQVALYFGLGAFLAANVIRRIIRKRN